MKADAALWKKRGLQDAAVQKSTEALRGHKFLPHGLRKIDVTSLRDGDDLPSTYGTLKS
jgi:hypothetical protein